MGAQALAEATGTLSAQERAQLRALPGKVRKAIEQAWPERAAAQHDARNIETLIEAADYRPNGTWSTGSREPNRPPARDPARTR
jgi:hypothetical protein